MHNGWCNTSAQWQICISKFIFIQRCRWYFSLYPISPIFLDEHDNFVWTFASCLYTKETPSLFIGTVFWKSERCLNTPKIHALLPPLPLQLFCSIVWGQGRDLLSRVEVMAWEQLGGMLPLFAIVGTDNISCVCLWAPADLFTHYADVKNLNVFREYVNDD